MAHLFGSSWVKLSLLGPTGTQLALVFRPSRTTLGLTTLKVEHALENVFLLSEKPSEDVLK